jgi:hypothetical protein
LVMSLVTICFSNENFLKENFEDSESTQFFF